MDNEAEKLIQARFDELPEDVQRAIESADVEKKVHEVGTKHQLHVDQMEKLDDETRLVMMGFVDPGEFADQVGLHVNVSPEQADTIANELSTQLFMPIRESMQKFMEERALLEEIEKNKKLQDTGKSVVMPSSNTIPPPPMPPKPVTPPTAPVSTPPAPPRLIETHSADMMLNQPTISMPPKVATPPKPAAPAPAVASSSAAVPKAEAPKPVAYKVDPYREQPE